MQVQYLQIRSTLQVQYLQIRSMLPSQISVGAGSPCLWVLAFCSGCWHAIQYTPRLQTSLFALVLTHPPPRSPPLWLWSAIYHCGGLNREQSTKFNLGLRIKNLYLVSGVPAAYFLFAGTVPAAYSLFAGTVPAYNLFLFCYWDQSKCRIQFV